MPATAAAAAAAAAAGARTTRRCARDPQLRARGAPCAECVCARMRRSEPQRSLAALEHAA
eukprot:4560238-Prymnesium_polylepis.1